jgi:hypothetical protein
MTSVPDKRHSAYTIHKQRQLDYADVPAVTDGSGVLYRYLPLEEKDDSAQISRDWTDSGWILRRNGVDECKAGRIR